MVDNKATHEPLRHEQIFLTRKTDKIIVEESVRPHLNVTTEHALIFRYEPLFSHGKYMWIIIAGWQFPV